MSDFDRNYAARSAPFGRAVAVDAGLRAYMLRVYNYMAIGVALTGVAAYATYQMVLSNPGLQQTLFSGPLYFVLLFVPLGLVFFLSFRIQHLQPATAQALFFIYAAILGVSLTPIFIVYTGASIARVFFISAASFGALSLYGYTTQRDLSGFGSFLMMGLVGIIIASLVNIFLKSSAMEFVISVVGVLVFAGLTAYDTQQIKEMYSVNDDGTAAGRKAIMGALRLYLDFINLFQFIMSFMGQDRE